MNGNVHSIQSLGTVDGPGVRSVVFMQGCPIRCNYCHNPDTWDGKGESRAYDEKELVELLLRYRPYFDTTGGVTISGGEPLMQADFVAGVLKRLKRHRIHTALDTSGQCSIEAAKKVLPYTDLAIVDLKFLTAKEYQVYAKADLKKTEDFLRLTTVMQIPLWIRHVVIPGISDNLPYLKAIESWARSHDNFKKIEWLPFHKLCLEKYEMLKIPFPLADTQAMLPESLNLLLKKCKNC